MVWCGVVWCGVGAVPSSQELDQFIGSLDRDGDGQVTLPEFVEWHAKHGKVRLYQRFSHLFGAKAFC